MVKKRLAKKHNNKNAHELDKNAHELDKKAHELDKKAHELDKKGHELEQRFDTWMEKRNQEKKQGPMFCFRKYVKLAIFTYLNHVYSIREETSCCDFHPTGVITKGELSLPRTSRYPLWTQPSSDEIAPVWVSDNLREQLHSLHKTQNQHFSWAVNSQRYSNTLGSEHEMADKVFFSLNRSPRLKEDFEFDEEPSSDDKLCKRIDCYTRFVVHVANEREYTYVHQSYDETDDFIYSDVHGQLFSSWVCPTMRQWELFKRVSNIHVIPATRTETCELTEPEQKPKYLQIQTQHSQILDKQSHETVESLMKQSNLLRNRTKLMAKDLNVIASDVKSTLREAQARFHGYSDKLESTFSDFSEQLVLKLRTDGTADSQPSTSTAGIADSEPPTSTAGTTDSQPPTSTTAAVDSQSSTSTTGTMDSQTSTSTAGTVHSQPPTSTAVTVDSQTSTSTAGTVHSQPSTSTTATVDSQTSTSRTATVDSQTSTSTAGTVYSQPPTSTTAIVDSHTSTSTTATASHTSISTSGKIDSQSSRSTAGMVDSWSSTLVANSLTADTGPQPSSSSSLPSITVSEAVAALQAFAQKLHSQAGSSNASLKMLQTKLSPSGSVNSQPSTSTAGTVDSQPSTSTAGTVDSQPSTSTAGIVYSQPSASTAGTVDSQPSTSTAGTVDSQPSTSTAGAVYSQPSTSIAGSVDSQPSTSIAGTVDSQPSTSTAGTLDSQPSTSTADTVDSQPSASTAGTVGSQSSTSTAGAVDSEYSTSPAALLATDTDTQPSSTLSALSPSVTEDIAALQTLTKEIQSRVSSSVVSIQRRREELTTRKQNLAQGFRNLADLIERS